MEGAGGEEAWVNASSWVKALRLGPSWGNRADFQGPRDILGLGPRGFRRSQLKGSILSFSGRNELNWLGVEALPFPWVYHPGLLPRTLSPSLPKGLPLPEGYLQGSLLPTLGGSEDKLTSGWALPPPQGSCLASCHHGEAENSEVPCTLQLGSVGLRGQN